MFDAALGLRELDRYLVGDRVSGWHEMSPAGSTIRRDPELEDEAQLLSSGEPSANRGEVGIGETDEWIHAVQ